MTTANKILNESSDRWALERSKRRAEISQMHEQYLKKRLWLMLSATKEELNAVIKWLSFRKASRLIWDTIKNCPPMILGNRDIIEMVLESLTWLPFVNRWDRVQIYVSPKLHKIGQNLWEEPFISIDSSPEVKWWDDAEFNWDAFAQSLREAIDDEDVVVLWEMPLEELQKEIHKEVCKYRVRSSKTLWSIEESLFKQLEKSDEPLVIWQIWQNMMERGRELSKWVLSWENDEE